MSSLRIGGIASGLDTENIIKEMLKAQRSKIERKVQEKTILEWKRDDFRTVNTKLLALRTATFDLKLSDTFNAKKAASSNESILTATAKSTATPGTYDVRVKQVAQKATLTSQQALGSKENVSSVAAQFGIEENTQIDFTLAGKNGEIPFSFTAGATSLADIIRIINDEDMGIRAYYDANVDRVFLMSTEFGENAAIKVKMDGMRDSGGNLLVDGEGKALSFLGDYLKLNIDVKSLNETAPASGRKITSNSALIIHDPAAITLSQMYEGGTAPASVSFTLKGEKDSKDFTFDTTISLQEMINQINNERLTTGLTASYDSSSGKVIFSSGGQVTISGDTDNFLRDKLNMTIGSQQGTLSSNTAVRVYDAANIKLNSLYTCEDLQFTLEGGQGSHKFSFNASSISATTVQDMIDSINLWRNTTGITASYDGASGKISLWDSCPLAALEAGSTATNATLDFNEALYSSSDGTPSGTLSALANGQDLTASFIYTGSGSLTSATYKSDGSIDFVAAGAADGDTITLNGGTDSLFDAEGNQHIPVTLTYDAAAGSWTYNSRSNDERMIAIRYDNEGFLADELNINMYEMKGTKAIIDFNDAQNLEFDTNEITLMDSINLNLQAANPSQTVRVTVTNDIDGAIEKIKAFVEAYNTAIVHMNTELTERRYNARDKYGGSFPPLTAEQKKEMSEDEIKAWEEKAKSGMLRGDSILFTAYSSTRCAATDPVQGLASTNTYKSLASIGISTPTFVRGSIEGGKLEINEDRLRAALEAEPDKVMELFTLDKVITNEEGKEILDWNGNPLRNRGVAIRLYEAVNDNITTITEKAGLPSAKIDNSLLTKEIGRIDDRIKSYEERMQEMSERYWKQFAAMEKMVNYYNSMSNWLSQQVAQMAGQNQQQY